MHACEYGCQKRVGSPEAGVTGSYELTDIGAGNELGFSEKAVSQLLSHCCDKIFD